jgi:serine/threonine protein kinase
MILQRWVGLESETEEADGPCSLALDEDRPRSSHESRPEPSKMSDGRDFREPARAGDFRLLRLLRRCGCPGDDGSQSSRVATVVASGPPLLAPEVGVRPDWVANPASLGDRGERGATDDPRRIGKYLVIERLDAGGQAQVYRVMHPELAFELVLKLGRRPIGAHRPVGPDGKAVSSPRPALLHEGRLLARCDHPNLVRVVDLDIHEGRPFVVMEYVPGVTLEQFALRHRPGPRQAALLVAELAGAVAYLHAQGIVHQDIKPRNVLIDERGRPRLIDLGLARWDHAWSGDSGDWFGGTAEYMSPEQALGRSDQIGPWTDIFGLGGLLYHLLTLGPPYRGASRASVARQAREAGYLPVRQLAPATPRRLARIVHHAMAADPRRRQRTAAELEAALRRYPARRRMVSALAIIGLIASTMALSLPPRPALPASPAPRQAGGIATPAAGALPAPTSRAVDPAAVPRISPLRVEAFRDEPTEALGTIGLSPRPVRVDDELQVSARFDAPAFGYLIAMDPDGRVQLCQPLEESESPCGSEEIGIPESKTYALTGRPGLQAFVVAASRKPLPPYEKWRGGEGLRRLWKPCDDDRAWRSDGGRFEALSVTSRGELKDRPGPRPPAPFRAVCDYLAQSREFEAIAAIAFPVKPKD